MACSCNDAPPYLPLPRVPLYAYEISPEGFDGRYEIPAQGVFIFPFWLCPAARVDIVTARNEQYVQDNSVRLWLSDQVLGAPPAAVPLYLNTWDTGKIIPKTVSVSEASAPAPAADTLAIILPTGHYLLHVHNLTNFVNRFSLRVRQCGVEGA